MRRLPAMYNYIVGLILFSLSTYKAQDSISRDRKLDKQDSAVYPDQLQTQLAETKQNFQDLLEDTSIRMHALQLSLDETEKFKAKTANNVTKSEDLMFSIAISVGHIRDKVSSCDWASILHCTKP